MARNRRSEPRCARCENEEDLVAWASGDVFCRACLVCTHESPPISQDVCLLCLREAYSIWTFEGQRIEDLPVYWAEAARDYGLPVTAILFWTFDEEELAHQDGAAFETVLSSVTCAPPHHRISPP